MEFLVESGLRTVMVEGEPWFVAKDVCDILGHSNTTMALQSLDGDERSMLNIGRQGEANTVNESGLYSLIMTSRKPEARKFKRWVKISDEMVIAQGFYTIFAAFFVGIVILGIGEIIGLLHRKQLEGN